MLAILTNLIATPHYLSAALTTLDPVTVADPFGSASPAAFIDSLPGVLGQYAPPIIGTIALGYLIWAGIQFIRAAGDSKKMTEAKTSLINVIIGVIIVICAYLIYYIAVAISNYANGTLF